MRKISKVEKWKKEQGNKERKNNNRKCMKMKKRKKLKVYEQEKKRKRNDGKWKTGSKESKEKITKLLNNRTLIKLSVWVSHHGADC